MMVHVDLYVIDSFGGLNDSRMINKLFSYQNDSVSQVVKLWVAEIYLPHRVVSLSYDL